MPKLDSYCLDSSKLDGASTSIASPYTEARVVKGIFAQALSASIDCHPGELIVAFIAQRSALTTPSGWTLLHTDAGISGSQWLSVLYRIATSNQESIASNDGNSGRVYISMVAIVNADTPVYVNELAATDRTTLLRTNFGLTLWGVHKYTVTSGVTKYWRTIEPTMNSGFYRIGFMQNPGDNNRACTVVDDSPVVATNHLVLSDSQIDLSDSITTQVYIPTKA